MSIELSIKNLKYENILNGIDLNLKGGDTLAIMGKNCSGKTTLLKSIFGILNYQGEIYINNLVYNKNLIDDRKKIGLFLGNNNLFEKTVFDSVSGELINLKYDELSAKKRVYETSKKLGIDNLLYRNVNELSHSQKIMVLFLKSTIHEPSVLLIDDLFTSLDVFNKSKVIEYIKYLKKKNKIIIIFTTNSIEDLAIANKLAIIKSGKIVNCDEVDKIISNQNILIKNNMKIPFEKDLFNKLKTYDLIKDNLSSMDEMVDEIWK